MINVGEKAPDFTLPDSEGNKITLSSFQGKENVVLIMYPGDDTPGCTKQMCAVRDNMMDFSNYDARVLGINHANAESHNKFIKKYGLTSPILVDEGRKIITKYGALKDFMGHPATQRSVIIIDKKGVIRFIDRGLTPHETIRAELEKLQ